MNFDMPHTTRVTNLPYTLRTYIVEVFIKDEPLLKKLEQKIIKNVGLNNYKTNVKGKMTSFNFFQKDPDFKKLVSKFFYECSLDALYPGNLNPKTGMYGCNVQNSWGNILTKKDFVQKHHHLGSDWASILYFNDAVLCTEFNKFKAQRGLIISLPSYVYHWVEPTESDKKRISLIWNWTFEKPWGKESYK